MNHRLDTDKQVLFYENEFYVLSNFSAFRLYFRGWEFDTSEAAYQAQKFIHSPRIIELIRVARSAHDAMEIARTHIPCIRYDWGDAKVGDMREILCAKVEQHEYVCRKLLETGDRELIEDSWRDSFWGWGINRDGHNMLGKLWMEIRSEIRSNKVCK